MPLSLATNALTSVTALADELGVSTATEADRLTRAINVASAAIEQFCDRKFRKEARTYRLAGTGTIRLTVEDTPLVSIEGITNDGETVDPDTYRIEDAAAGIIVGDDVWHARDRVVGIAQDVVPGSGEKLIVVSATTGYVLPGDGGTRDLPYDIEQAALITAASLYRARGADRRIASEALGDYSVTYGGVNEAIGRGIGGVIPDEAAVMLAPYRRVVMV